MTLVVGRPAARSGLGLLIAQGADERFYEADVDVEVAWEAPAAAKQAHIPADVAVAVTASPPWAALRPARINLSIAHSGGVAVTIRMGLYGVGGEPGTHMVETRVTAPHR